MVGRTLHVADEDAHGLAEDEVLQQCRDERERHAEHGEQEVADGQVQQEQVGDGAHAAVVRQRCDHERVAGDRQHEDDGVETDACVAVVGERSAWPARAAAAAAARRRRVPPGRVVRHRQQPTRRRDVVLRRIHH